MKATSPFRDHCGLEVIEARSDGATVRMRWQDFLRNEGEVVHGGALTTLIDSAIATAIKAHPDTAPSYATIELSVKFLAGAKGDLLCKGRVIRMGRRVAVGEAEVHDASGARVAVGQGTWILNRPLPAEDDSASS